MLNLVRSVASSIGVSIALTVLTRSAATARSGLVEHVTPYNEALRYADIARYWDPGSLSGLARLEREIELQAAMIGYAADFRWLAAAALLALPLLLFIGAAKPR